ncbi:hypothetical protein [Paenibacillus xylanexedens]|uniref:hypothetical protein n=1 Tax=Paenibacillus xylanexedens TaxID=528191 RepID=UPI00119CD47E|nr:hypothetical protein [Paenibacillus xylanexedens]
MPVKYLGWLMEIIYEDHSGNITKRRIQVKSIRSGLIKADDLLSSHMYISRIGATGMPSDPIESVG